MSSRERDVVLVASGDSRLSANQRCWPAQEALEAHVSRAFAELGRRVVRGHPFDPGGGRQMVADGKLAATFVYPTGGREAVEIAAKILAGQFVPHKIVLPTAMITRENAAK